MTGLQSFLASIANQFIDRNYTQAQDVAANRTPEDFKDGRVQVPESEAPGYTAPVDQYEQSTPVAEREEAQAPTADKKDAAQNNSPLGDTKTDTGENSQAPSPQAPVEQAPDGTYSYKRKATLEYKLDLRFNLSAVQQTMTEIANGDLSKLEEVAKAGFGMTAKFDLRGSERIKTTGEENVGESRSHSRTKASGQDMGRMKVQSRDFKMKSFYRESVKVRRSVDESVKDSHRRTTNRFALRYRLDNKFSMEFAQKFNAQTEQVAKDAPESTEQYVNTAGEVAAKGSTEMMATFFNAVDGYLDATEDKLVENVTAFFDAAAEELGFSGAQVDMAREHLTSTIENFFDKVDTALAGVQTKFQPPTPAPTPTMPANLFGPSMSQDSYQLATA